MVKLVSNVASILIICLAISPAFGGDRFPVRPVRLVIPYTAGGMTDIVGRIVGQELSEIWGRHVVIDNRLGAGGNIGTEMVAQSAPDGYNLLLNTASFVIAPSLSTRVSFDPIKDFVAVAKLGYSPALLLVNPSLPVNSVSELVALAKAQPGKLNYGSAGIGTSGHLASELFKKMANVNIVNVSYKGNASIIVDLMSGQVQVLIGALGTSLPLAKSGKIKVIAVTTAQRSSFIPDLPTISESGVPGYDFSYWYGIFAPAKTPPLVIAQINRDIVNVVEKSTLKQRFAVHAVTAESNSLSQFAVEIKSELQKWSDLIKSAGITQQAPM